MVKRFKTPPSHGGIRGSIPLRVTMQALWHFCYRASSYLWPVLLQTLLLVVSWISTLDRRLP